MIFSYFTGKSAFPVSGRSNLVKPFPNPPNFGRPQPALSLPKGPDSRTWVSAAEQPGYPILKTVSSFLGWVFAKRTLSSPPTPTPVISTEAQRSGEIAAFTTSRIAPNAGARCPDSRTWAFAKRTLSSTSPPTLSSRPKRSEVERSQHLPIPEGYKLPEGPSGKPKTCQPPPPLQNPQTPHQHYSKSPNKLGVLIPPNH
jgi:hypothetical protein